MFIENNQQQELDLESLFEESTLMCVITIKLDVSSVLSQMVQR